MCKGNDLATSSDAPCYYSSFLPNSFLGCWLQMCDVCMFNLRMIVHKPPTSLVLGHQSWPRRSQQIFHRKKLGVGSVALSCNSSRHQRTALSHHVFGKKTTVMTSTRLYRSPKWRFRGLQTSGDGKRSERDGKPRSASWDANLAPSAC